MKAGGVATLKHTINIGAVEEEGAGGAKEGEAGGAGEVSPIMVDMNVM